MYVWGYSFYWTACTYVVIILIIYVYSIRTDRNVALITFYCRLGIGKSEKIRRQVDSSLTFFCLKFIIFTFNYITSFIECTVLF